MFHGVVSGFFVGERARTATVFIIGDNDNVARAVQ